MLEKTKGRMTSGAPRLIDTYALGSTYREYTKGLLFDLNTSDLVLMCMEPPSNPQNLTLRVFNFSESFLSRRLGPLLLTQNCLGQYVLNWSPLRKDSSDHALPAFKWLYQE